MENIDRNCNPTHVEKESKTEKSSNETTQPKLETQEKTTRPESYRDLCMSCHLDYDFGLID